MVFGVGKNLIPRETWVWHNEFMVLLSLLFAGICAAMAGTMIRHRRRVGPGSRQEWLWGLLPLGILLGINFLLMERAPSFLSPAPPPPRNAGCAAPLPSPPAQLPAPG